MAADGSEHKRTKCGNSNDGPSISNLNDASDTFSQKKSLHDLNDDCLLEIFEMVGNIDWIRLSKVSPRFRSIISRQILSRRPINFSAISRNQSIRKVFKMFGQFASDIRISATDLQYQHERRTKAEELFHLLAKHCHAGRLRDLSLSADFSELRPEFVDKLGLQLANLRHISMHSMRKWLRPGEHGNGDGGFTNRLLSHAKKIESFEFINMPLDGELLCDSHLGELKKVSIFHCTAIEYRSFYELMQRIGKQVQTFEWKNSTFKAKSSFCQTISDVCEVIGDCLPNLTTLTFEMNYGQNYCAERTSREWVMGPSFLYANIHFILFHLNYALHFVERAVLTICWSSGNWIRWKLVAPAPAVVRTSHILSLSWRTSSTWPSNRRCATTMSPVGRAPASSTRTWALSSRIWVNWEGCVWRTFARKNKIYLNWLRRKCRYCRSSIWLAIDFCISKSYWISCKWRTNCVFWISPVVRNSHSQSAYSMRSVKSFGGEIQSHWPFIWIPESLSLYCVRWKLQMYTITDSFESMRSFETDNRLKITTKHSFIRR